MKCYFVHGEPTTDLIRLDVDSVFRRITEMFPGTEMLWEDLYAREREEKLAAMEQLALQGNPVSNPGRLLDDIESKRRRLGRAKGLLIRRDDGNILVTLREVDISFNGKSVFDVDTRARIGLLLHELALVQHSGFGVTPDSWGDIVGHVSEF